MMFPSIFSWPTFFRSQLEDPIHKLKIHHIDMKDNIYIVCVDDHESYLLSQIQEYHRMPSIVQPRNSILEYDGSDLRHRMLVFPLF